MDFKVFRNKQLVCRPNIAVKHLAMKTEYLHQENCQMLVVACIRDPVKIINKRTSDVSQFISVHIK